MNSNIDFADIAYYADNEIPAVMQRLVNDEGFMGMATKLFAPVEREAIVALLTSLTTAYDFKFQAVYPFFQKIVATTTDGFSVSGFNYLDKPGLIISNHRDIVMDPSFVNLALMQERRDPSTIAIGDNLLSLPWVKEVVRTCGAFIVKRQEKNASAYAQLSAYIQKVINDDSRFVWIAQREGRAKDSNDQTQESILKMFTFSGEGSFVQKLQRLNLIPTTISYEYDPCDYLKAKEFQLKRDNPSYKKSRQDDLENMKVGIMGYKGRIHYQCAPCIDTWLSQLEDMPSADFYTEVARRMDKAIHAGYRLFPNNYIALDKLNGNYENAEHYTAEDKVKFEKYLQQQIDKIDIPNKDVDFLTERLLTMYANPLRNHLAATK